MSDKGKAVEKLLPQNLDAETGVLGSILIDPEALDEVSEILTAEMFYREAHRTIFQAAMDLYEQGIPADLITLTDELERRGKLEDLGGTSYVSSLANQVPTSANALYYAGSVEETFINRSLIHAAGQIAAVAYNRPDATSSLEQAEKLIFGVASSRRGGIRAQPISSATQDVFDRLDRKRDAQIGVPTDLRQIDQMLGGGLQKSDLIILAARPGVGKTSLALSIADTASAKGLGVMIFSLEMSKEQLANRLVAMEAKVDSQKLRNGYLGEAEVERVVEAIARVNEYPIYVDDTAMLSISELRSRARRQMLIKPFDVLIVDYIQLMTAGSESGGRERGPENRQQEVSVISRGLKAIARELNVPVLALSQLSRAVEARADKKPQLSDLRDSGALEQDADVVAFIYREEMHDPDTEKQHIASLIIAKHRNGPIGDVGLYFEASTTRYRDLHLGYPSEPSSSYGGDYSSWSHDND
jgi:replicative DNA helicase